MPSVGAGRLHGMLNVGGGELLLILLVALIFLGPQRLPDVARQVGQTVGTLRGLARSFQSELEAASRVPPQKSLPTSPETDTTKLAADARGIVEPLASDEEPLASDEEE